MSEPAVASSDATNLTTSITRDGDDYVVNGRKWFVSGAADPRCRVVIVMGNTGPEAPAHRRQSTVLVPMDTPGVEVVRHLPVFGYQEQHGYSELVLSDVRVPVANLLGAEGDGLRVARTRLNPGRIHHCMRAIGMAERALELLCARAANRVAFGMTLTQQGVVQQQIAESRLAIEQARLLGLRAAWLVDTVGAKAASAESPPSRPSPPGWPARSSTGPSRSTAPWESPTTSRWPRCTPTPARCASWAAPTRCICAPSPAGNSSRTCPDIAVVPRLNVRFLERDRVSETWGEER